jgi:hypothetical protein
MERQANSTPEPASPILANIQIDASEPGAGQSTSQRQVTCALRGRAPALLRIATNASTLQCRTTKKLVSLRLSGQVIEA